ncbi:hypothetical protein ODJ79_12680 [Actinoplanes sp. KI2]|uniref:hypothetical protein n=1 Tax=Actinoplanes sp. KI2 TaxID=2983315 RepID=UPI0021D59330|nr:hypothetical protein [Actinoplanes sp. KI2]MCU7724575.1 hypothetical protein [Actinoplanes sp. KI2]
MKARTMARTGRAETPHTDWCARGHRCGLIEHRSTDTIVKLPGHGEFIVTRVLGRDGFEYAEIRGLVRLHTTDAGARWQLRQLLAGLPRLLNHLAIRPGVVRDGTPIPPTPRPALDRRPAA